MASLYKRSGRDCWLIAYTDHNGKRREKSSRTTDKKAAERIAARLEAQAALRRERVIDPAIDELNTEATRPITQHVTDYRKQVSASSLL